MYNIEIESTISYYYKSITLYYNFIIKNVDFIPSFLSAFSRKTIIKLKEAHTKKE